MIKICNLSLMLPFVYSFDGLFFSILLQASKDAKRIVEEERANAHLEVESARNAVQRVQQAVQEHEKMSQSTGKQVCDTIEVLSHSMHFGCYMLIHGFNLLPLAYVKFLDILARACCLFFCELHAVYY
jgi:hypothetical protein